MFDEGFMLTKVRIHVLLDFDACVNNFIYVRVRNSFELNNSLKCQNVTNVLFMVANVEISAQTKECKLIWCFL